MKDDNDERFSRCFGTDSKFRALENLDKDESSYDIDSNSQSTTGRDGDRCP